MTCNTQAVLVSQLLLLGTMSESPLEYISPLSLLLFLYPFVDLAGLVTLDLHTFATHRGNYTGRNKKEVRVGPAVLLFPSFSVQSSSPILSRNNVQQFQLSSTHQSHLCIQQLVSMSATQYVLSSGSSMNLSKYYYGHAERSIHTCFPFSHNSHEMKQYQQLSQMITSELVKGKGLSLCLSFSLTHCSVSQSRLPEMARAS